MIIVNQDKDMICNFDNSSKIEILGIVGKKGSDTGRFKIVCDDFDILGIYTTEKRAKEVLEDITDAYLSQNVQKISPIDINIMQKKIAYVMPKE